MCISVSSFYLLQIGPIPEVVLANMTFQILWALAYLKHEKRVHRDIKPSNLLINRFVCLSFHIVQMVSMYVYVIVL